MKQNARGTFTAYSMTSDFSAYTTNDLLRMRDDGEDRGQDFGYNALWAVFARWRKGIDLEPLIALLESTKSDERMRGAWYLEEASPPADNIAGIVIKLADDPIGNCRWKFVQYVTNSGLYDDVVASRLAACLLDRDLSVRVATIFWAVVISDEEFAHFSAAVLSGAGKNWDAFSSLAQTAFWRESEHQRAVRGIDIAQRLRAGESLSSIHESIPGEDSYTFDHLTPRQRAIKRRLERRTQMVDALPGPTGNG